VFLPLPPAPSAAASTHEVSVQAHALQDSDEGFFCNCVYVYVWQAYLHLASQDPMQALAACQQLLTSESSLRAEYRYLTRMYAAEALCCLDRCDEAMAMLTGMPSFFFFFACLSVSRGRLNARVYALHVEVCIGARVQVLEFRCLFICMLHLTLPHL
jgi:hypothetical protein